VSLAHAISEELSLANRILSGEEVVDGFGHVSARHPDRPDRFLLSEAISPASVTAGDILELTLDGEVIEGEARKSYLERFIHAAIYAARPDVCAVVHNHSQDLIPYGVTGTPIRPLIHTAGAIGHEVPIWDIADRFGDTSLLVTHMASAEDLAQVLGANTAVLMRGHGATVAASSIRDAVLLAIYLQINARLDMRARQLGPVRYLSDAEIALSRDALLGAGPAKRAWDFYARRWG
jgi:HCOMODA/2-hydroxy-3-carboxy-muconic semialdehyde decarboxylase